MMRRVLTVSLTILRPCPRKSRWRISQAFPLRIFPSPADQSFNCAYYIRGNMHFPVFGWTRLRVDKTETRFGIIVQKKAIRKKGRQAMPLAADQRARCSERNFGLNTKGTRLGVEQGSITCRCRSVRTADAIDLIKQVASKEPDRNWRAANV